LSYVHLKSRYSLEYYYDLQREVEILRKEVREGGSKDMLAATEQLVDLLGHVLREENVLRNGEEST
ncbi:MAG: hypothetical protein ACYTAF_14945, partial [Planctomycetota bacterium]